jgi:hypothetical protein
MRGHGKTHQDIANVVGQSTWTVAKAIGNDYARPDDIGADYDFVDAETKKEYPPKVSPSPILCKTLSISCLAPMDREHAKRAVRNLQRNNRNGTR